MESICANCHWYKPKREHANIINCLEHFDYHKENDTCGSFCEDGKYVPTGIWAGVAEVVKAVSEEVKKESRRTKTHFNDITKGGQANEAKPEATKMDEDFATEEKVKC